MTKRERIEELRGKIREAKTKINTCRCPLLRVCKGCVRRDSHIRTWQAQLAALEAEVSDEGHEPREEK